MTTNFIHPLGALARSKTVGFKGVIMSRAESLYGCNRYNLHPKVGDDGKVGDSYWLDEADIEIVEPPAVKREEQNKTRGGPISKTV